MIKVRMIGTGSAFSKRFINNSALLTMETGYKLLLDCGHSVPRGLHEQGIPMTGINGILITHLHNDHVGGLEEMALYSMYNLGGRKLDLYVPGPLVKKIWDNCLKAGLAPGGFTLHDYFNVKPLDVSRSYDLKWGKVKLRRTTHVESMFSVSVSFDDFIFYSSDTVFDPKLIAVADRHEIIFHDCQLEGVGAVHATLEELKQVSPRTQSKMYLMHYGDNVEEFIGLSGRMVFARQGLEYSFTNPNREEG
jgi:ribonuclease BN (tRNA processing enzyme)